MQARCNLPGQLCVATPTCRTRRTTPFRRVLVVESGKGFGTTQKNSSTTSGDEDISLSKRARRKGIKQQPVGVPQQNRPQLESIQTAASVELPDPDEEEFDKRLEAIKLQGAQASAVLKQNTGGDASASSPGLSQTDIYSNPPSVTDTILNQLNSDIADPKMKTAQFGPGQLFLAGGAVVFGLAFLLSTGGDFAVSKRFSNVRPAQNFDPIQEGILKSRAAQLELKLQEQPDSTADIESLAVTYAKLFELEKAANILERLVAKAPDNVEAWRLLGETALLNQQSAKSVKAYEKAVALKPFDSTLLSGLSEAYVSNGQQAEAVQFFKNTREKLSKYTAMDDPSSARAEPATSATEQETATEVLKAAVVSNKQTLNVDSTSLDLLIAKVYSNWRGHEGDAAAAYDTIVKEHPEDYRGYLAKGVFLRDKGRRSDAERMFIQARFYAPDSKQGVIARMSQDPVLPGAIE